MLIKTMLMQKNYMKSPNNANPAIRFPNEQMSLKTTIDFLCLGRKDKLEIYKELILYCLPNNYDRSSTMWSEYGLLVDSDTAVDILSHYLYCKNPEEFYYRDSALFDELGILKKPKETYS